MKVIADTICAPSTPLAESGIAVIRISGPSALELACKVFVRKGEIEPERVIRGRVKIGDIEDNAILIFFKAPRSYTGEDVVELQVHGNPILVRKIMEELVRHGCRPAEAGEFTKRAFLNGKMDLLQAEAVGRFISAKSELGLKIASRVKNGGLSRIIGEIRELLIQILAQVEGAIEFPDDIEMDDMRIAEELEEVRRRTEKLLGTFLSARKVFEGYRIVITGRPNVGKSTLFNQLLGYERAIVTPYPGTTRDYIDSVIFLDGRELRFYDTAGLRKTAEPVEKRGVALARKLQEEADVVILLFDASMPPEEDDFQIIREAPPNALYVLNKVDLGIREEWEKIDINFLRISALRGEGVEELKRELMKRLPEEVEEEVMITEVRHRDALERAGKEIEEAEKLVGRNPELLAEHLRYAARYLHELLEITHEDVLNEIFSRFCVGK